MLLPLVLILAVLALGGAAPHGGDDVVEDSAAGKPFGLPLQGEAAEAFLRDARVVARESIGTGITRPQRVTLSDGSRTLDAAFKSIDERRMGLTTLTDGRVEMDFRDTWKSEVAAFELDKLLGLGLVPPTVERRIDGRLGALQLWVVGTTTEKERRERHVQPPDPGAWNRRVFDLRLLRQLAADTDAHNVTNVLVDPAFRLYAIDFSRAFRIQEELLDPDSLQRFSRKALSRLNEIDRATVEEHMGRWLSRMQIDGLLGRRDRILALARERVASRGEDAVLYP